MIKKLDRVSPETLLQRKNDILFNIIEGEVIMLSVKNSEYYNFGKVGSRIWEILEKPIAFKSLIGKLQEEFDVSMDQCTKETMDFVDNLIRKKLIKFI